MKPNYVWSSIGKLLMIIGCCMLIPAIVGIFYREQEYQVFLETALGTALVGALLYVAKKPLATQNPELLCGTAMPLWPMGGLLPLYLVCFPIC